MKSILTKLNKARSFVRDLSVAKNGTNSFAKYDYFQPDDIADWTHKANEEFGILDVYSNEIQENGTCICSLTLFCTETGESVNFKQVTAKPVIKATNEAQQFGGMVTYSNRYILQTAYKIAENSTDSDAHDNRKTTKKEIEPEKWLNAYKSKDKKEFTTEFSTVLNTIKSGKCDINYVRTKYKVSKETAILINELTK